MNLTEQQKTAMTAYEAFIRRASEINMPFMLKGSYVTRQYFPENITRIPADLDWVYIDPIDEPDQANLIFSRWVVRITELTMDDGVVFRSFKENSFWRMMDYAMADDFPTVNTDILCWVDGIEFEFGLDISFNLEIPGGTTPLAYKPMSGSGFTVPHTAPLHLQVAWKIHQTLVRPRLKDLFDLMYLVQHPGFDKETLLQCFHALLRECIADELGFTRIENFLNYQLDGLFRWASLKESWEYWRHGNTDIEKSWYFGRDEMAGYITNANRLPVKLTIFMNQFRECMESAGFTMELSLEFPHEIAELYDMDKSRKESDQTKQDHTNPHLSESSSSAPTKNRVLSWIHKLLNGSG